MRFDWATRISLDNLRPLLSLFSADLAIDLGTVNTRVYAGEKGIVINEPSAVALDNRTGEVQAVGKEAKEMLGRTPGNLRVVKPMKDGVIADFKVTEKMLNYFIQKAHQRRTLVHPRIVISVPSEITQVEKRAVTDAAYRAKAAEVHLVEQAMMAAIGAGLPVTEAGGNMVVDIGGGTTDVAVISLSGIVYSRSLRIAGNHMDEAITNYLKRKYNLLIGERTARLLEVRTDSLLAVIYIAGRDDLVARVLEGGEGDIELVPVLGLHVLADGPLASLAQLLGNGHSRSHWRSLASMSA